MKKFIDWILFTDIEFGCGAVNQFGVAIDGVFTIREYRKFWRLLRLDKLHSRYWAWRMPLVTSVNIPVDWGCPQQNIVEIAAEEQHPSPCRHGNIIDRHACYCHAPTPDTPRKCHIWSSYGEHDLTKWRKGDWESGCPFFEAVIAPDAI